MQSLSSKPQSTITSAGFAFPVSALRHAGILKQRISGMPALAVTTVSAPLCCSRVGAFGDLPPVPFKYREQVECHVMTDKISFEQAEEAEEGDDCSWISVYRLYGCEPLFV
jgi:hypothetical protein